jgi:hypothetical protein
MRISASLPDLASLLSAPFVGYLRAPEAWTTVN